MIMKKLFSRLATKTGGEKGRDEDESQTMEETSSRCSLSLEGCTNAETTIAVAGKSILSGSITTTTSDGKEEEIVGIVTRFRNYFALFDGRTSVTGSVVRHDPSRVRQVVADLFDESVQDEQMEIAEELLAKGTIITVNRIERCRTGRIFYHLRVSTRRNPNVRQHVTGFAMIHEDEQKVVEVETTVKLIHARGGCCRRAKKSSGCMAQ